MVLGIHLQWICGSRLHVFNVSYLQLPVRGLLWIQPVLLFFFFLIKNISSRYAFCLVLKRVAFFVDRIHGLLEAGKGIPRPCWIVCWHAVLIRYSVMPGMNCWITEYGIRSAITDNIYRRVSKLLAFWYVFAKASRYFWSFEVWSVMYCFHWLWTLQCLPHRCRVSRRDDLQWRHDSIFCFRDSNILVAYAKLIPALLGFIYSSFSDDAKKLV